MPLDPISTVHHVTGAVRLVSPALLAETYLSPIPETFDDDTAIREARKAPWSASFAVAADATIAAVSSALRDLIHAAPALDPDSVAVDRLPEGRARTHLTALRDIWRDIGRLPEDLAPLAHALSCSVEDALAPMPLLSSGSRIGAKASEDALAQILARHHGAIANDRAFPGLLPAGSGLLSSFQSGEMAPGAPISVTALRDPLEELRYAAARAQRMLDDGAVDSAEEIGLLLPDDPAWLVDAEAVFANLGLHLGGLPGAPTRDRATEALHLILTVLNKPAPGMAAVALDALNLGAFDGELRGLLHRHPATGGELAKTLHAIATRVPGEIAKALRALPCGLEGSPVDWAGLIAATRPGPVSEAPVAATRGAIAVFTEGQTPWREVRQLLALGFAGDRYPSVSGSGPFWLEHEIDLIEQRCGIALPGRRASLELAHARLKRQFAAVSEGIEITCPVRDRAGARLAPSAALDMIAYKLGRKAEDLIRPLSRDPAEWSVDTHVPRPAAPKAFPTNRTLDLNRDLTGLRLKNDGSVRPQSPSRLDALLVSPLAWLLGELGIEDKGWGPDSFDMMERGSLMHKVLEALFPPGAPPDPDSLAEAVPLAVDAAIEGERDLRFLTAPAWAVERRHIASDLTRIAIRWAEMLRDTGATIHATEQYLAGAAFGMGLHGKADTLLELPNGTILVIDYKSGKSTRRVKRMKNGWDLQAELYGNMIRGSALAEGKNAVAVGYLCLADMVAVTSGTLAGDPFGPLDLDTHAAAEERLTETVAALRQGRVRLNGTADAKDFDDLGVGAYALDNPIVSAFLWEGDE